MERLRASGVEVTERHHPGMFHGFFSLPAYLDDARDALADEAIASTASDGKNCGGGGVGAG
ncbi:alpha/beta hydrolase [Streptomyces sp. A3M-1-3]|nr:alpha/beta hydrolase [Streptomyces sp. A3M-1-3]